MSFRWFFFLVELVLKVRLGKICFLCLIYRETVFNMILFVLLLFFGENDLEFSFFISLSIATLIARVFKSLVECKGKENFPRIIKQRHKGK